MEQDGIEFFIQLTTIKKIMIVFSGSEGGLQHAIKCCRYLQDNGVNSLALGYFKTKHSQKKLNLIPIDIFKNVIEELKKNGLYQNRYRRCFKRY